MTLSISSSAFKINQSIPKKYTCQGKDINPPLQIKNIPEHTESLVLIIDDPDAPGKTWVHWVIWNIPTVNVIEEDSIPGIEGTNDFKRTAYGGPCPPSGKHRYFFKVYALDSFLDLNPSATKKEIEETMKGHILAQAELIGVYKKS